MDNKQGCIVVFLSGLFMILVVVFGFFSRHIFGNKQIIDFNHQKFNVAYVKGNSNIWERIQIKAWKDWETSDSIQIITEDGNAIYTHLSNVKLMEK